MKPSNPSTLNRRRFLTTTSAAIAAISVVPRHVLGGAGFVAPSETVNVALIGCGGQGRTNAQALFRLADVRIPVVADPIESFSLQDFYYRGMGGRKPVKAEIEKYYGASTPNFKVTEYEDYRVLLEKEKGIDAVLCATPDHAHAVVVIDAMRQGKHAYCEKPLTHNVWESRLAMKVAKETGVATQLGNQGHSGDGIRQTCEWIWDGAIGEVREVHAWTGASRWNKQFISGRPPTEPMPTGVNWDLWLGPRSDRPYSSAYTPVTWRDYFDFGTAPIGDFFCHNFDAPCWALDLKHPETIEGYGAGGVDAEIAPPGAIYYFTFGARGNKPPVKVTWYDGSMMPPRPEGLEPDDQLGAGGNGTLFIGDKGMLTCPGWAGAPRLLPGTRNEEYRRPPRTIPRSNGHHRDWIDAIKGGPPASANFEYGGVLSEIGLLALVALRTRKKIHWDAVNLKATNAPEADRYIQGDYRPGWKPV
jgi:predicted dehydrogenase